MAVSDKVKEKLRDLPDKPGCYLFRDRRGKIIYVGKAVSLRKRVQSYFRDATLRRGAPKLRGLVKSVDDIEFLVARNEAEALLTEGRLIKDYRPRYNVSFKDDKRFLLLRVNRHDLYPVFKLCRIQRDDQATYFGPYASSAAARVTLDFIEKRFGLRKCAPRVPDEQTYRHCLNDIIRFCSAPCMQRIDEAGYHARVDDACAFLRGERPRVLEELRDAMDAAAAQLDFEQAGALRDTLFHLRATIKQRARHALSPEVKRLEAHAGVLELQHVLGLAKAPMVIEAFDISNTFGTFAVASMVCAVDGLPNRQRYRRFRIKTVDQIDDPRMMAEVVSRRYKRLRDEQGVMPGLVLVDGGISQMRAARAVLDALGLDLPCAGLAKRFEEIYWGDGLTPILLPRDSQALLNLRRLRDEAHRFALTYHRSLRNQRIKESMLDEIPGIGPARKRELLAHFGSFRRLLKATEDDIAAVPGIGKEIANQICTFIHQASWFVPETRDDPPSPSVR